MPQITIDNQTFEFEGKPKLLQFCLDHGVELPHFCYHPSMSIPANCRQCLVEIGSPVRDRDSGEVQVDEDGSVLWRAVKVLGNQSANSSTQLQHAPKPLGRVEHGARVGKFRFAAAHETFISKDLALRDVDDGLVGHMQLTQTTIEGTAQRR